MLPDGRLRRKAQFQMHTPALSPPIHVLVADAESLQRWALVQTLSARGCEVTDVASAAATHQVLSRPHPDFDVILLDHCISDTHDLSLLTEAAALSPRSRIVLLTACMTQDLGGEARRRGADAILEKPVDLDTLADLVTVTPAGHRGTSGSIRRGRLPGQAGG